MIVVDDFHLTCKVKFVTGTHKTATRAPRSLAKALNIRQRGHQDKVPKHIRLSHALRPAIKPQFDVPANTVAPDNYEPLNDVPI